MLSFKLLPKGSEILKQYFKNRPTLFEVVDKNKGNYIVRAGNKNFINHWLRLGIMFYVGRDEGDKDFYALPTGNLFWELEIDEVTELINFIDKIRDKTENKIDLRLFKD